MQFIGFEPLHTNSYLDYRIFYLYQMLFWSFDKGGGAIIYISPQSALT